MRLIAPSVFACLAFSTGGAFASVSAYYSNYYRFQSQTSDAAPSAPSQFAFSAFLITSGSGEATSIELKDPNGNVLPTAFDNYTINVHYGNTFATQSAMQAAYPAGNYSFKVTSGPLAGPTVALLPTAAINFPNRNPYFDSGTYSALQNATAGVAKNISWGTFSNTGPAAQRSIGCNVVDMTEVSLAFTNGGDQTYTSDVIAASKMKSGHRYFYNVIFTSFDRWLNAGFGTATASVSYVAQTDGRFNVKANPGTIAGKLELEGNPYITGRPVRVITRRAGTNTILDDRTITAGYEGYYAFEPATTGMVDVYFKSNQFLTKRKANINLGVGQDNIDATLLSGDCNSDDVVDLTDYTVVALAFNATPASISWDAMADLNGDSVIDLTDYTWVATNFNGVGDRP